MHACTHARTHARTHACMHAHILWIVEDKLKTLYWVYIYIYHNTSSTSASCRIAKGVLDLPMKTKTTVHWAVSPVSHSYIFNSFQSACCMVLCWQVELECVMMWVWNLHLFECYWEYLPRLIAADVSCLWKCAITCFKDQPVVCSVVIPWLVKYLWQPLIGFSHRILFVTFWFTKAA